MIQFITQLSADSNFAKLHMTLQTGSMNLKIRNTTSSKQGTLPTQPKSMQQCLWTRSWWGRIYKSWINLCWKSWESLQCKKPCKTKFQGPAPQIHVAIASMSTYCWQTYNTLWADKMPEHSPMGHNRSSYWNSP